jgi:RNA polymerase sigma-70 factor (ECF subfamily)
MASLPENERSEPRNDEALGERIEALRPALKGYVLSLLPRPDACEDVVQETCLVLWERRAEFDPERNFKAWAFKVAWFKALSHRRDMQRDKLVSFSEDVLQRIAGAAEEESAQIDRRMEALRTCLAGLPADDLRLLELKYINRASLAEQARQYGWKPNRLQKMLSRLRLALRHCIESQLSKRT